jgi:hypothetical protein
MVNWKETAKVNGIHPNTYRERIRLGWDPVKAAKEPPQIKQVLDKKWVKVAEKNGIQYHTYLYRLRAGWTLEDAATKPAKTPKKRDDREWRKLAKENGISKGTYHSRVDQMWWTPEEAATTKVLTKEEIAQRMVETNAELNKIKWDRLNKDPNNLFKLTPEHIESAKQNGICKSTLLNRVYYAGWAVKDAISTPPMNDWSGEYYDYLKMAKENGISDRVYRWRIKKGWSFIDAATKEVQDKTKRRRPDGEWLDKAIQNGINKNTYYKRIRIGWTPEEAATKQPLEPGTYLNEQTKEKSLKGYKKFKNLKKAKG